VIITGVPSYDTCTLLRDALTAVVKGRDDIIIVASTDLSHHYPDSKARLIDKDNLTDIAAFDPELLFLKFSTMSNKDTPCGRTALIGTMMAARNLGANKIDVLKYATSGDVTIDKSAVVGYASLVIYKSSRQAAPQTETEMKEKEPKMEELLNAKQKRRLLVIARATLEAYIKERRVPDFKEEDPVLNEELGAFVTLHKNGQLRGCIGNMTGKGPLYLTIRDMAVSASTQDPRFPPVRKDELKDIDIEISVLSPMKIIDDPEKIVIGKHGVMVQKGFRSGVYLPQVGTETGWSRERFMDSLCLHKAGLPADSWKKGGCDIYIFTAEVFGEKETEE